MNSMSKTVWDRDRESPCRPDRTNPNGSRERYKPTCRAPPEAWGEWNEVISSLSLIKDNKTSHGLQASEKG